jgi:hypothetical protein
MPRPEFTAVIDTVPAVSGQFVVCLGRPRELPDLTPESLLVEAEIGPESLARLSQIDPRRMRHGLVIVTCREQYARHPRLVLQAQKLLLFLFTKFVRIPSESSRVPDPMAMRPPDTPPEYLHLLNIYHNTPFHLRSCLVDKLRDERVGLPCLLLLPGPSLAGLKDRLREFARRYLIVTISRVLPFLRQAGLAPDVLVQLDTVPLQAHFHHPNDHFPRSILLALSLAPIRAFAPRFRQLFFIDSFDPSALPNPSRIRESWLSSLIACLGCAEALQAPKVLLAGADLRLAGHNVYHEEVDPAALDTAASHDAPLTSQANRLILADAQGRLAETTVQYLATAAEAELCAREIQAEQGTTFRNLSSWSLLDPEVYAPMTVEEALEDPELDRESFLAKADAAAGQTERINLRSLRAKYSRALADAKRGMDLLTCLRTDLPQTLSRHPYYRYVAANVPWFRPSGETGLERLAVSLAGELLAATRFARNMVSLHLQGSTGKAVAVLCTGEEEAKARERLGRLWPDWSWRCLGIRMPGTGRPEPSAGCLELGALHDWLQFQEVVVVAPEFAGEYQYAMSLVQGDNCIALETLAAYAPGR